MKYLFLIVAFLFFTGCSESGKSVDSDVPASPSVTVKEKSPPQIPTL